MKTLQEFEKQGGCEGCAFHQVIDIGIEGQLVKGCTFHWFDDESDDWEYSKNCDDMEEWHGKS